MPPPTDAAARPPAYASVRRAAAYAGLGERTVRRLIASGRLPAHRVGARVLVAYRDLDALILGRDGPVPAA